MIYKNLGLMRLLLVGLLFAVILAACDSAAPVVSETPGQTSPAAPTGIPATDTPQPTEPPPAPLALLLAPSDADAEQVSAMQTLIADLAAQEGFEFEMRTELDPAGSLPGLQVVVALPPDPGVSNLAAAYADARFLAVGFPGLQPGANLSIIGAQGDRPDQLGFLGGYIAAVITPEWRVGVLSVSDSDAGQAAQQGFINGVIFFCGLCRPAYPPFYQYPVFAGFPAGATFEAQQAAADTLIASAVETVYVHPGAGGEDLLAYLAQAGLQIIGGVAPPSGLQERWVVSIRPDWQAAVRMAWPMLVAAEPAVGLEAPLALTNSNENLFSPGRQGFVERLMAEMAAGFVDSGVAP